jgi:hypothetical protein
MAQMTHLCRVQVVQQTMCAHVGIGTYHTVYTGGDWAYVPPAEAPDI